jgi:hypothetical protein
VGEVVVVINNSYWSSSAGEQIRKYFGRSQEGLPQEEAIFTLVNIPHSSFNGILQRHRVLLLVDIDDKKYSKPAAVIKKNVWASNQVLLELTAPNEKSAYQLIEHNQEAFLAFIQNWEIQRMVHYLEKNKDLSMTSLLREKVGLSMAIPNGFSLAAEGLDFIWLKNEIQKPKGGSQHPVIKGLLIHSSDYTHENMLKKAYLMNKRDSLTKKYIPGGLKGSYMQIVPEYSPVMNVINLNEKYTVELRGLWNLNGDFMGGPFLSYTTVHESIHKVVTVEAFLYCPKFDKREYLRELEAILKSLKLDPLEKV